MPVGKIKSGVLKIFDSLREMEPSMHPGIPIILRIVLPHLSWRVVKSNGTRKEIFIIAFPDRMGSLFIHIKDSLREL
jgi:hypothetical protein